MVRKSTGSDRVVVRVLGATDIRIGTRSIGLNTEALYALALYVTTRAGDRIPREELLETFWPTGADESRRHAMRQMLYRLRQKGVLLQEDGDFLILDPAQVDSDLLTCLTPEWAATASTADIAKASRLTPVFSSRIAAPFLTWYDGVRERLLANVRRAAQAQIVLARREGRWSEIESLANTILASDPFNEEAVLAHAESAAMNGSKLRALEILDHYINEIGLVAGELGKPVMTLRKRIAERRADWTEKAPREVRLVGRVPQVRQLHTAVEAVLAGKSQHCRLLGAAGIGKSRLLAEARDYGALRGLRIVAVDAEPMMEGVPLGLFRAVLGKLLDLPGAAGTTPIQLELLRRIAHPTPDMDSGIMSPALQSRETVAVALQHLTQAIAQEVRVLVIVDDLQYGDASSLKLLFDLERSTYQTRLGVLSASRFAEWQRQEDEATRPDVSVVRLAPLTLPESRELLQEILAVHRRTPDEELVQGISAASGGNPLFLRELALSGRGRERQALPESLNAVIQARLRALPEDEVRVLRLICLLGEAASIARLSRLSGSPAEALQAAIGQLELDGILAARSSGVLFLHDAWRETIVGEMPATVRLSVALECAEDLLSDSGTAGGDAERAAYLLHLAGEHDRALRLLLQSSDALYASGLAAEALSHLEALHELAETPVSRVQVDVRRARILLMRGEPEEALALARACLEDSAIRGPELAAERLMGAVAEVECAIRLDRLEEAPRDAVLGLAKNSALDPTLRHQACLAGVRLASNAFDQEALREFAQESFALNGKKGSNAPAAWMTRAIAATECSSAADIIDVVRGLDETALDTASIAERCLLERVACHAMRHSGDIERATYHGKNAYYLATEHDLAHQARIAADALAFVNLDYERTDEALQWIEKGKALETVAEFGITKSSTAHAEDRLLLQQNKTELLAGRIRARPPSLDGGKRSPARFGELSIAAIAYALYGDHEGARQFLDALERSLPSRLGQLSLNFAIELSVRALRVLGDHKAADALLEKHIRESRGLSRPPLPPFFLELRKASASDRD